MYDFMFEWLRTASKEERHCEAMEHFARKHPLLFIAFHAKSKNIVHEELDSQEYLKAKEELIKLFTKNTDDFAELFAAVKKMTDSDEM